MNDIHVMITKEESELVMKITRRVYKRYCPAGKKGYLEPGDLTHFGMIGLIEAKGNFDPKRKVPWLKFAAYRIFGAMLDEIRKAAQIRLPQERYKKVQAVRAAVEKLTRNGTPPTPEALGQELGWPTVEVIKALSDSQKKVAAASNPDSADDRSPAETEFADRRHCPETAFLQKEREDIIKRCLDRLNAPLRFILKARILENVKLKDLAATFGLSIESVRLRQLDAQAQMKACLEQHGWTWQDVTIGDAGGVEDDAGTRVKKRRGDAGTG